MALRTVHLNKVLEYASTVVSTGILPKGIVASQQTPSKSPKFHVIGHRGSGMNMLQSSIKENTLLSFNNAKKFPVHFIEFDVQVTKDNHPVIFHDNFILTEEENNTTSEKRVTELTLAEFLCYGPQRESTNVGKPLLRRAEDGRIYNWKVEEEEYFCTLQETFENVDTSLGFNIELKFDDLIAYEENEIVHVLQVILDVVNTYAKERPIIFSTFQPDAAKLIRSLQKTYPVFFLTEGGTELYPDVRRNSLDEAIKLCMENGLQGVVSEVRAIFRNPGEILRIKESSLSLLTYGELNNVCEAVYMQHLLGVNGVIADMVGEISVAVSDFIKQAKEDGTKMPRLSHDQLSFLTKLIPELMV